jgi:predicted metal-binding protein
MSPQSGIEKFAFLKKIALDKGAADAQIIPADKIVIEDRVVLKCKLGCSNYGKTLMCPPYTPSAEEFRRITREYSYALFMKFKSKAEAEAETAKYLSKSETDPALPSDMKEKIHNFWEAWREDKQIMLSAVIDLEKAALNKGYPLAVGLVSGTCYLCEKCSVEKKVCAHPMKARYSEDAVGVNVKATAKNAGISVTFPYEKNPESFALVLID